MWMILPAATEISLRTPRRLNSRTASRAQRNWPVRLMAMTVFHCSSVISSMAASRCRPALATRMSIVPKASSIVLNMAWTSASLETSALTAMALTPAASISAMTSLVASSAVTKFTATSAPALPRPMATALPMPELAPVTSAFCPARIFGQARRGRSVLCWVAVAMLTSPLGGRTRRAASAPRAPFSRQPRRQVIAHAQRVCHDGEGRVHASARREEAAVDDIQVVELVRLAVEVQGRGPRVEPESYGPVLVRDAGERNASGDVRLEPEQVVGIVDGADLLHHAPELRDQPLVRLVVVRGVLEHDATIRSEAHPVVGVGEILGGQPERERVRRHSLERPARRDPWGARAQCVGVRLSDHGDVSQRELPLRGREVEVVEAPRLLEDGRVRVQREGEQERVDVTHVVAADDARAVRQPLRVAAARRSQEQRGGVDGAAGDHDDTARVRLLRAVPLHVHRRDFAAAGTGLEARDIGARDQGDVRVLEGGIDADHLRVGLGVDEAREAVTGVAADALAPPGIAVVAHDADGQRERLVPDPRQVVDELLDPRLVAERWEAIRCARRRLRRVGPPLAVHLVEMLGLRVIGLEILVGYGPGGGDAAVLPDHAEILPAQAQERRAVELGVAAHEVVGARNEFLAVLVEPRVLDVVATVHDDGVGVPVLLLARHVVASLEEQDALACGREPVGQRSASRSGPDDDHVVRRRHVTSPPSLAVLLEQLGHEPRPARLVAGAETGAVIAVEVFVERNQAPPVRVPLEHFRLAVDGAAPVGAGQKYPAEPP